MSTFYIYKIECPCGLVYIGSTRDYRERIRCHKGYCRNPNMAQYNYKIYKHIRNCCSWERVECMIIYTGSGDKSSQAKTERHYQIHYDSIKSGLNVCYALGDMTKKEMNAFYCDVNRERMRENSRVYAENNREKLRENSRVYAENNREKLRENNRVWCLNNPERVQERQRVNYETKRKVKVPCDLCGKVMTLHSLARHKRKSCPNRK